jgi:multimeric flavodoxin WrbA
MGNSAAIARRFCETAVQFGAEIQSYMLNELTYLGCQGCLTCKTRLDRCVLEDGLTGVLESIRHADILLIASPIYFADVPSQLKAFIDRTFSYLLPDYTTNPEPSRLSPGKKLVFILAQGNPDENRFDDVFPKYNTFFQLYGFSESHLIRVCGVRDPGEAKLKLKAMRRAEDLAAKLVGNDLSPQPHSSSSD